MFVDNARQDMDTDPFSSGFSLLRTLRLTNNPLSGDASKVLLELLKTFPQLQVIQSNVEWEGTCEARDIQHLMDINCAGRVLLLKGSSPSPKGDDHDKRSCKGSRLALSMWPTVLARLTQRDRYPNAFGSISYANKSNANGVYYLLRHGPIFMETLAKDTQKSDDRATPRQYWCGASRKRRRRDPALGGYYSFADFLSDEAAKGR